MSMVVDDEFLYLYMPQAEQMMLDHLPPENKLHHRFSRRFRRKMRALLRYERRTPKMRKLMHGCKVAAAVLAVVVSVTFGALMSVEACRTRIIEAVTKVFEEFTSVRISANGGITDKVVRPIIPMYVPEGYVLKEEITNETDYMILYENQIGKALFYTQELLTASEHIFDTEDAYTTKTIIGSQEIYVIMKESTNVCQIYWYDELYFYWLDGQMELRDDLFKMAENIIEQKK